MGFDLFMTVMPSQAVDYEPELPDRPDWFRFAWRGMAAVHESMCRAGALEHVTPRPLLPEPSQAKSDAALRSLSEQLLTTESDLGDAVPDFKFTSNDGWLVTPAECNIIASRLREALERDATSLHPDEHPDPQSLKAYTDLLYEWVAYNRLASTHGGYRVR